MFSRPVERAALVLLCLAFLVVFIWLFSVPTHAQSQRDLEGKNILILHSSRSQRARFRRNRQGTLNDAAVRRDIQPKPVFRVPGPEAEPWPRVQETSGRANAHAVQPSQARHDHHHVPGSLGICAEGLQGYPSRCPHPCPVPAEEASSCQKRTARIIGHSASPDIIGTLEIALKLVPGAKRVYVVSGAHEVDRRVEDQARRDLQEMGGPAGVSST